MVRSASPTSPMPLAVVIADPDIASGRVLARQLEDDAQDVAVLAVVGSGPAAAAAVGDLLPDVVLLAMSRDTAEVVRVLRSRCPSVGIVLLTSGADDGRAW